MLKPLVFGMLLVVIAFVETSSAAQLTVSWADNSGGGASFRIERRTSGSSTFSVVASVSPGVTSWIDASVLSGNTYCYRVRAFTATAVSSYSNEACSTPGTSISVAKAGTGGGTVVSVPVGISCGAVCSTSVLPGTVVTLAATPASGSTFSGWSGGGCTGTSSCVLATNVSTAVTASFAKLPTTTAPAITLTYNGKRGDRVGPGNTARAADGVPDGTFTVRLQAGGGRTVTSVTLEGAVVWDTNAATSAWLLGVARSLDYELLNGWSSMAVAFPVADGESFVIFASDSGGSQFLPGRTLRVTTRFSDGTTATASTTIAGLAVTYNGKLRDRVGAGNTARASDGALDGALTVRLYAPGGRTFTRVQLMSSAAGAWDTDAATSAWLLGVASSLDGSLMNSPATMGVYFSVGDGGSFVLFASDSAAAHFVAGRTLTVSARLSDGTTWTGTARIP